MKKNIFSIAAILLATVVIFSSCGKEDLNDPVVTLTGDAVMELDLGDTWDDPGATATDEEDGKITSKIVVVGEVDTDKVGAYEIVYKVTDKAGNEGSATRIVNVKAGKLAKTYTADIFEAETDELSFQYTVSPQASSVEYNKLIIANFSGYGQDLKVNATVIGNTIYIAEKTFEDEYEGSPIHIKIKNGEGTYEKVDNNYNITGFTYTEELSFDSDFNESIEIDIYEVWTVQ